MLDHDSGRFIIDQMTWSFSRLNSFYSNCRYEWYMSYIERMDQAEGFFAQFGKFCHEILEKYIRGDLSIFDISQYYVEHFFEEVTQDAPPNKSVDLKQSYYEKGLEYFNNIDFDLDNYEVLGVEKEVHFNIDKYPFIGFIDVLLRDKADGKLILCDHKSSTIHRLKSGGISKSDMPHFQEFKRQQYLYSKAVMEEYGDKHPIKELRWNMFKDRDMFTIPFDKDEFDEACNWALDTIHLIEEEEIWAPSPKSFYCNFMCSMRNNCCPYKV